MELINIEFYVDFGVLILSNLLVNIIFKYHYHILQLNFYLKLVLIRKDFVHKVYFEKVGT